MFRLMVSVLVCCVLVSCNKPDTTSALSRNTGEVSKARFVCYTHSGYLEGYERTHEGVTTYSVSCRDGLLVQYSVDEWNSISDPLIAQYLNYDKCINGTISGSEYVCTPLLPKQP